jgi:hypothetical protein
VTHDAAPIGQTPAKTGKHAWVIVRVAVGLLMVPVVFFLLPRWLVRVCATTDQASQLSGRCLTAEQRLKAESDVRTSGVQALGGLVVLAGIYFTWGQVQVSRATLAQSITSTQQTLEATQRLAVDAHAHEREMAAEQRRQDRRGDAYVDLVAAVIATTTYYGFHVQQGSFRVNPPPLAPPDAPIEKELYVIAAKLYAFGSSQVKALFKAFLDEVARVRDHPEHSNVTTMRELVRLESAIQDRVHAELDAFGGSGDGGLAA